MHELRLGDWIQTYSGAAIYPLDPRPEELNIIDIAHGLSNVCRYAGQCLRFYSVAEHSVLLAEKAPLKHKLTALLHDASEAYLADIPRPIKQFLPDYGQHEARLMRAISDKFGVLWPLPDEVKRLDNGILQDERAQNMARPPKDWALLEPAIGVTLQYWPPPVAFREFTGAFWQYGGKL